MSGLSPLRSPPTDAIISPLPCSQPFARHLAARVTLVGTCPNHRQAIWVVIFSQRVGRFYPQNRPADVEASANWSSVVYLGVAADLGARFDILAVVADAEAQQAFSAYLAEARDKSDWPGLVALSEGAVIYDRVTVVRK